MKIIATICAKGSSTRLPGKNIKLLAGKPLIAYAIETAFKSRIFDRVIAYTDDTKIAKISRKYGVETPFMEPMGGHVSRWAAFKDVAKNLEKREGYFPDIIIDLSPTCPLRRPEDVKNCLEKLLKENADVVTSVYESDRNPYFNMLEERDGKVSLVKKPQKYLTCSQDTPKVYSMNDAVYAIRRNALHKKFLFENSNIKFVIMPRERSIDIDTEFDFKIAEFLIKNKPKFRNYQK